jgi:hypothetical protein
VWLGFPRDTVETWLEQAGLEDVRIEVERSSPRGKDLPDTFIASARRPD